MPHRSLRESGSAVFGAGRASDVFVNSLLRPGGSVCSDGWGRAGVRVCAPGGDGEMQFFDSLMHVAHFVFSKDDGPTNLNERSSCIQMHCARMHQRAVATTSK